MREVSDDSVAELIVILGNQFPLSRSLLNDIGAFAEKSHANYMAVAELGISIYENGWPDDESVPLQFETLLKNSPPDPRKPPPKKPKKNSKKKPA